MLLKRNVPDLRHTLNVLENIINHIFYYFILVQLIKSLLFIISFISEKRKINFHFYFIFLQIVLILFFKKMIQS